MGDYLNNFMNWGLEQPWENGALFISVARIGHMYVVDINNTSMLYFKLQATFAKKKKNLP